MSAVRSAHGSKKKHFLEVEFENKFRQEERKNDKNANQRKYQIGSCHYHKMNYDVDECFFVKEDIPEEKLKIHREIKDFIDPDYLSYAMLTKDDEEALELLHTRAQEQTYRPRPPEKTSQCISVCLTKIRIGLENDPTIKYHEPKIYSGTECRDRYQEKVDPSGSSWNVSAKPEPREINENLKTLTQKSMASTKKFPLKTEYIGPVDHVNNLAKETKQMKSECEQKLPELKRKFDFENPKASSSKTKAAIFRMYHEQKQANLQQAYNKKQEEYERRTTKSPPTKPREDKKETTQVQEIIHNIKMAKQNKKDKRILTWIYEGV